MPWIDRTKKIKQPKPKYVHHSNMSHKYYNSKQWKDMRNIYYKNHPFCGKRLHDDVLRCPN